MLGNKTIWICLFALLSASGIRAQGPPESQPVFLDKAPVVENLAEIKQLIGYPLDARRSQITGTVIVQVLVDENGAIERHHLVSDTLPILTERVLSFISQLKVIPAQMDKRNVPCWVEIPFEFSLPGKIYFTVEDAMANKDICTQLDLGDLGLTEIPKEVFDLPNLTALNLSNNRLSLIPSEIAKLNKLVLLNLDNNQFTEIPKPVMIHSSILILQMRDNKIPKEEFKKIQRTVKNKKVLL